MSIRWSEHARQDLFEIVQFISRENPVAAQSVIDRIESAVQHLEYHPNLGRPGRVANTRELFLSDLPYVIPYRVSGLVIEIIRVLHTARKWPGPSDG